MSKFSIQKSDAPFMTTYIIHYGGEALEIAASDLPALAAYVSAAMAEQKAASGPQMCLCGNLVFFDACEGFVSGHPSNPECCARVMSKLAGVLCGHHPACHHPRPEGVRK